MKSQQNRIELVTRPADSQSSCVVVENAEFKAKVEEGQTNKDVRVILLEDLLASGGKSSDESDDGVSEDPKDAMLLYTSGTTGSPKGVVITAENIVSQVENMTQVWPVTFS